MRTDLSPYLGVYFAQFVRGTRFEEREETERRRTARQRRRTDGECDGDEARQSATGAAGQGEATASAPDARRAVIFLYLIIGHYIVTLKNENVYYYTEATC